MTEGTTDEVVRGARKEAKEYDLTQTMKTTAKATFFSNKTNDVPADPFDKDNMGSTVHGTKGGWLNTTNKVSALI